jgi:hypothetical protein
MTVEETLIKKIVHENTRPYNFDLKLNVQHGDILNTTLCAEVEIIPYIFD